MSVTLVWIFCASQQAIAVPAYPHPVQYKQPDGSVVTLTLKGDERIHWATSPDGYTLLANKAGFYEYAKASASGDLLLSGIRYHNADEQTTEEKTLQKSILKNLRYSKEQEGGVPMGDSIWSHAWGLGDEYELKLDGVQVYSYSCSPEFRDTWGSRMTHIGVIAHELSHVFGLPDFYDTDYDWHGQSIDTGEWDIMARGSWNDNGRTPANHTAWSKNYLGWVPATALTGEAAITLPNPVEQGAAYKINTKTPNEYFLLENRQKQGWDAYIPASGLLIYHVDENISGWNDNCVNCYPSHRGLYVKQAGGGINSNSSNRTVDPYPYGGNDRFTDTSIPNAKSWADANTSTPVTKITHNTAGRSVSFQFMENPNYYDAGLLRFVDLPATTYYTGKKDIQVEIKNNGRTFTAATIAWSIDGQAQTEYTWTGSLLYDNATIAMLGSVDLATGTHTITATITVAGDTDATNNSITTTIEVKPPKKLPYTTEFNGSLDDWESVDIVGGVNWEWSDNADYQGYMSIQTATRENGYALYGLLQFQNGNFPDPATGTLISPVFDFSDVTNAIDLSFDYTAMAYYVPTTLKVQASTDHFKNQITDVWSSALLQSWSWYYPVSETVTSDLSAFAGERNVQIRFLYEGGIAFGWAVDDISIKVNNEPRLKTLTVSEGQLMPAFNPVVTHYTMKVPNETSSLTIGATPTRPTDSVTGTGVQSLKEGNNVLTITVSNADGSAQKVYTLTVKRLGATLKVPFTEDFETGAPCWTTENGTQPNQWYIGTATAASGTHSAYISNDGGITNAYDGNNQSLTWLYADVLLTPHANAYSVYELRFDWKSVGESCCDYTTVYLMSPGDDNLQAGEFPYNLRNVVTVKTLNAADTWKTEIINLSDYLYYFQPGDVVRLAFGWYNDYSFEGQPPIAIDNVSIQSIDPTVAKLEWLSVNSGNLMPWFSMDTYNYTVTVKNAVNNINIDAATLRSEDTVSGTGTKDLNVGENKFEIVVSNPEKTEQNIYTIIANRLEPAFEVPFTENFETKDKRDLWNFANEGQANQWVIGTATAATGSHSAYISNDNGVSNQYGDRESISYLYCNVDFSETYYDTYQLSFDWKGMGDYFSGDCLEVYLVEIDTQPVAGKYPYELTSNYTYLGKFSNSDKWQKTVIPIYSWYVYLNKMARLLFMWQNDAGRRIQPPIAIDNICVQVSHPSDATLLDLKVSRGSLSPIFHSNRFNYTVNVANEVNNIVLEAIPNNFNARVIGANKELALNEGSNTFNILVVSEDLYYENTYTVKINRTKVGMNNPNIPALNVYPNPTSGILHVENSGGQEIKIYDALGKAVLQTRDNRIDLSAYPKGMYLLRVAGSTVKVVKQ